LKRSNWQVLALYLGTSWVALQVVDLLKEHMGLPDWVFPGALALLAVGLPIVMATALIQARLTGSLGSSPRPAADDAARPEAPPAAAARLQQAAEKTDSELEGHQRLFTWRNAILGGVAAFVLLGIVTAGFMVMRNQGIGPVGSLVASGVLSERASIVVADFESSDASLGRAATQALRVDLSQSDRIRVVEPATLGEALARMQLPENQALTFDVARDLAVREGYPAVVEGELTSVGTGYSLTARLADAASGETLANVRETATGDDDIIAAIDRLSRKMRERIGDSYTNMRADEPLERVTTGSLEALEKYSRALELLKAGRDGEMGVTLLEEAVEIDPGFAMAWRKLGVETTRGRASQIEAFEKAYEFRDRLTPRERLFAEAAYYENVENDSRKTIGVYERLVELDPTDEWALNNLGATYFSLGEWEEAEHWVGRAVEVDSTLLGVTNVALLQLQQGKLEEADATLNLAESMVPDNPRVLGFRYHVEMNRESWDEAEAWARRLAEVREPGWAGAGQGLLANIDAIRGRLADAEAHWRTSMREQTEAGIPFPAGPLMQVFDVTLDVRGDTAAALAVLAEIRRESSLAELNVLDRPYRWLAMWYARAGDERSARTLLNEMETEVAEVYRRGPDLRNAYRLVDAHLLMAEQRPAEALRILDEIEGDGCNVCPYVQPARAFDQLGRRDTTIALYEGYLAAPDVSRAAWDNENRGPVLERLAQLYDEAGDLENAALTYARFTELWEGADPELQPRVRAARARLEEILRERG
jgi:eukaryotic-like serine/threonine-protein kinase